MPQEFVIEDNHYTKWSNELRVSTPQDYFIKGTVGLFARAPGARDLGGLRDAGCWAAIPTPTTRRVSRKDYTIPTLNNNTIWLTDEERVDRDYAAFAQVTWDIGAGWSLTGGFRQYRYDNSLQGFYGYSRWTTAGPGVALRAGRPAVRRARAARWSLSIRTMRRFISRPART